MAECSSCGYVGDDFYPSVKTRCRPCVKRSNDRWRSRNPEYMKTYSARHRSKPGWKSMQHILHRYGLTLDQYEAMVAECNGLCEICHQPFTPLNVDHCHETGEVRGLLCRPCNTGLGLFKDKPELLYAAANYLERTAA